MCKKVISVYSIISARNVRLSRAESGISKKDLGNFRMTWNISVNRNFSLESAIMIIKLLLFAMRQDVSHWAQIETSKLKLAFLLSRKALWNVLPNVSILERRRIGKGRFEAIPFETNYFEREEFKGNKSEWNAHQSNYRMWNGLCADVICRNSRDLPFNALFGIHLFIFPVIRTRKRR